MTENREIEDCEIVQTNVLAHYEKFQNSLPSNEGGIRKNTMGILTSFSDHMTGNYKIRN